MAAVAQSHINETPGAHQSVRMADSTTSFTAVNGTASPAPQGRGVAESSPRKETVEKTNYSSQPPSNQHDSVKPVAQPSTDNRDGHVRSERGLSPAPPMASAPPPAVVLAPSHQGPSAHQQDNHQPTSSPHTTITEQDHAQPTGNQSGLTTAQQPIMSPQKRKRTFSEERENPSNPAYHQTDAHQSSEASRVPNGVDSGRPREPYSPQHAYPPPQDIYQQPPTETYPPPPHHAYPPPPEQRGGHPDIYPRPNGLGRNDYDPPLDPSIAPSHERPYYSDSHLAEALQRENRSYDAMSGRENYVTPEDDDDQPGQYTTYGGSRDRDSQSVSEMDRKRRKRVFSNRTKTGCMTCRRRKKKCDEQHPECNNCLRGGFVCEGYSMRNTWQKPANVKQPIPLQSKNGYPPQQGNPGRAPYPAMSRYQDVSPEYSSPAQTPAQGQRPSSGSGKRDSITAEDDGVYGRTSPPSQKGQSAWTKASSSRPYPSNPPQASKYQENEHRGSVYEVGPDGQEPSSMQPPPAVNRTGSAQSQYSQAPHPPSHNNTPPNAQAAAQAALTHPASVRPSQGRRSEQYTEREKMLKGMYYYPMTPALTEDRERCIAAIWRFNNATNPSHGASPEERTRLFRQILSLRPSPEPPLSNGEAPPTNFPLPFGSCGERVVVEAPFHCDYGYNITVSDDVLIGADCRISDTCSVTIGARCIFSPNVKLVCATYPIDPRRRMGSNGPALGRNIVIEEDCWIGANVTILAGVRVGKSSTVGAGSLLHQDVPRFTVVAGNPAKVSRGIYDGSGDGQ